MLGNYHLQCRGLLLQKCYTTAVCNWNPLVYSHTHVHVHTCTCMCVISHFFIIRKQLSQVEDMYNLLHIVHVCQLTNNSPLGSNFTESTGASWPWRVHVFEESETSTTLMINSAEPAARWVWLELTSRHVTGAVNLINRPSLDPCVCGEGGGGKGKIFPICTCSVLYHRWGFSSACTLLAKTRNYMYAVKS